MQMLTWNAMGLVAALLLVPGIALAQVADSDGDGFPDTAENAGITLAAGLTTTDEAGNSTNFVPPCTGGARAFCMDSQSADLFAIVVPTSPSGLPADPFRETAAEPDAGGLGITVHALTAADPTGSRVVSPSVSTQSAVRITESLAAPGDKLGLANYGTPNGLDGSTIWTTRIAEFVNSACSSDALCETSAGAMGRAAVTEALTRWILNHEVGHLFALTAQYDKRFGGYHVKAGENEMMTQFVDYDTSRKTGITTFYIPTQWSDLSRADKLLQ